MAGLKLRKARESRRPNVSQYKLADELGITRSRVASYEGGVADPPADVVQKLSRMWNIPEAWFWDEIDTPVPVPATPDSDLGSPAMPMYELEIPMPFRGYLPADEAWDVDDSEDDPTIDIPSFLGKKHLADPERVVMRVKNRSMEKRLFEHDIVIVVEDYTPRIGRLVVARSGNKRTVKVLTRGNGATRYTLESINPESGNAEAEEWEIVGYVIAILRDYAKGRGSIEWDEGGLTP